MAYSNFNNLKKVQNVLGLKLIKGELYDATTIQRVKPSDWLKESIVRAQEMGYNSEKERSERLISPVLSDLSKNNIAQLTIYSGHELNVDKHLGLNGECDFLLALGRKVIQVVDSPIFSVVEAKRQDINWGTAQCAAQLVGAAKYNEMDGKNIPYLYGGITDGVKWNFIKLEGLNLVVDERDVVFSDMALVLGIIQFFLDDCKKFGIV